MDTCRIQHIASEAELLALEPEWRRLEARMLQVPFVSFDWLIPWWQHFRAQKQLVRDELFAWTFRASDGELLGIAPLMLTHRPSAGPLRYSQLQFFGADPNITELRCIAAATEHSESIYAAMLEHIAALPKIWHCANLTGLPQSAELEAKLSNSFVATFGAREIVNPILILKPTWDEFKSGLPRNIKEALRKCYNAPKRDGIRLEFQVIDDATQVQDALQVFFRLHRARSELEGTVHHMDCFASLSAQRFLRDVCARFAKRGALRIFQIKHLDAVIATRIGFVLGDSLYLYYSGYDPIYKRYSVMTTVVAEAIKYAIAAGFRTLNLSTGRDVSKTRWSPTEVIYKDVEFSLPSTLDILRHRGFRAVLNVQQRLSNTWLRRVFSRRAE